MPKKQQARKFWRCQVRNDLSYDEWRALLEMHKEEFFRWKRGRKIPGGLGDARDFWRLFRWWYWNVALGGGN